MSHLRAVAIALLLSACATTRARPEVLTVRDPNKLCRIVAFSRCHPGTDASSFIDTDGAHF